MYSQQPAELITAPDESYYSKTRSWQGIPGIAYLGDGAVYAVWYTGDTGEGVGNHIVLCISADYGASWSEPVLVVQPDEECRVFDPVIWKDPEDRLWLFWAQSRGYYDGRAGVWYSRCDDPQAKHLQWGAPERISHGIMMNKPTVLSNGTWLLPVSIWGHLNPLPELEGQQHPFVLCSDDSGAIWQTGGMAQVPETVRTFDEHMIVERANGSLWMLMRTKDGIYESASEDGGLTWSAAAPSALVGVDSRFFIRRSSSGRLLLISNNSDDMQRINMTAFLSDNDGQTWSDGLLLDHRNKVSYPDGSEIEPGRWIVVYDRERNDRRVSSPDRLEAAEILLADITEEDILNGKIVNTGSRLQVTVSRLNAV